MVMLAFKRRKKGSVRAKDPKDVPAQSRHVNRIYETTKAMRQVIASENPFIQSRGLMGRSPTQSICISVLWWRGVLA